MGLHRRHVPAGLAGKLRFERGPDGRIHPVDPPSPDPEPVHPETIAEERPPQAPDPRRDVPPWVGPV